MTRGLALFFRSPRVIVAEVVGLAVMAGLATAFSQDGASRSRLVHALWLDRVFTSPCFVAIVALCAVSLSIVALDQWRRALRSIRAAPRVAAFGSAPFVREFERDGCTGPILRVRSEGRIGALGSPVFHLGLTTLVVAGTVYGLFGREAVVRLVEGETLPASASAYGRQWGGPLSRPFALEEPLVFEGLQQSLYPSGRLRQLSARVTLGDRRGEIQINAPLEVGRRRLHLTQSHGTAALFEIAQAGKPTRREAVLLDESSAGDGGGIALGPDESMRVRARARSDGVLPDRVDVRFARGETIDYVGETAVGVTVRVRPGLAVRLISVRYWAEFRGSRDTGAWAAYLGFALCTIGVTLMLAVVRVDTLVEVVPIEGGRERVRLAMRPNRFVPLYADRFQRFVRAEQEARRL